MAAKERGEVTQWAFVPLISFLRFVSLSNERLRGPGITKVRDFCRYANFLIANDKMFIKTLLQPLPLRYYCFQQVKSLRYRLMLFQNCFIT